MAITIGRCILFRNRYDNMQQFCSCRLKVIIQVAKSYTSDTNDVVNKAALEGKSLSQTFFSEVKKTKFPKFIDYLQILACGGPGGQGLPKFGGFGGDGGKVLVMARKSVKTLRHVLQKYPKQMCKAEQGEDSDKFRLLGDRGANSTISVPVGVLVHKPDGKTVDLNNDGDTCIVAVGGQGGNNKTKFLGLKGDRSVIGLELKLLADVGLVGFPNAGKSTFLKAISRAKPKITPLPFTTLSPQLGMMPYEDGRMISVADLPGLIEGASQNFGMGFKFLRHVERTKILLYMLDIHPFQLTLQDPERTPFETLLLLIQELDEYGHGMLEKPSILALNKIDTDSSGQKTKELLDLVKNLPDSLDKVGAEFRPATLPRFEDILCISAEKKINTDLVKNRIREIMDEYADKQKAEEQQKQKELMQLSVEEDSLLVHQEHLKTTFV